MKSKHWRTFSPNPNLITTCVLLSILRILEKIESEKPYSIHRINRKICIIHILVNSNFLRGLNYSFNLVPSDLSPIHLLAQMQYSSRSMKSSYSFHGLSWNSDTVKSWVLTRLVMKHMVAFSDCLYKRDLISLLVTCVKVVTNYKGPKAQ